MSTETTILSRVSVDIEIGKGDDPDAITRMIMAGLFRSFADAVEHGYYHGEIPNNSMLTLSLENERLNYRFVLRWSRDLSTIDKAATT